MKAGRFRWSFWVRLLFGAALLLFLIHSIGWEEVWATLKTAHSPGWMAIAVGLTGAALFVGAIRWQGILRLLDLPTPFIRSFRAFFIGQFFNAFLFGACGGDLVRAIMAAGQHDTRRAEAVTSVFLDRALGLFVTLGVGCIMLFLKYRSYVQHVNGWMVPVVMGLFLCGTLVLYAALFSRHLFERFPWLQRGWFGRALHRAYDALYIFRHNAKPLLVPLLWSALNLLLLTAAAQAMATALKLDIPFSDMLMIFPVITVLSAIPLTPGSLGIRENLYVRLLAPIGVGAAEALSLSFLIYLAGMAWSLLGGLLLLLPAGRISPAGPPLAE